MPYEYSAWAGSDFWVVFAVVVIAQAIVCAALSANRAGKKGFDSGIWGICGFFLGIFGLIAAAGLPPWAEQRSMKKCPDCSESIKIEARVCKYCNNKFSRGEVAMELEVCLTRRMDEYDDGLPTRRELIENLGQLGVESSIPLLVIALRKGGLTAAAEEALVRMGPPAVPYLNDFIKAVADSEPYCRRRAEEVLKKTESQSSAT